MGARQAGLYASLQSSAAVGADTQSPGDSSRSATRRAMDAALEARGFAPADFGLEEDSSHELSRLLGVVGGILTVRCRSTGEERFYSSGTGSAWFGAFLMDLGRGHFADALRHAPVKALQAHAAQSGWAARHLLHS